MSLYIDESNNIWLRLLISVGFSLITVTVVFIIGVKVLTQHMTVNIFILLLNSLPDGSIFHLV